MKHLTVPFSLQPTVLFLQKEMRHTKDSLHNRSCRISGCQAYCRQEPVEEKDFSPIIEHAKNVPAPVEIETGEIIGGFAHNQVIALADKVVEAVKSGAIRKFFVMAGCDGRMKDRNYYTEFAQSFQRILLFLRQVVQNTGTISFSLEI